MAYPEKEELVTLYLEAYTQRIPEADLSRATVEERITGDLLSRLDKIIDVQKGKQIPDQKDPEIIGRFRTILMKKLIEREGRKAAEAVKAAEAAGPQPRGCTPRAPFSVEDIPQLNDYLTVPSICKYIEDKYAVQLGDESVNTTPSRWTPPALDMLGFLGLRGAGDAVSAQLRQMTRMESSGSGLDCLIHSFFTATCAAFRRLPLAAKNTVANAFRHCFLYRILDELDQRYAGDVEGLKRSKEHRAYLDRGMLYDKQINLLADSFKVNILVLEQEKAGVVGGRAAQMPATATLVEGVTGVAGAAAPVYVLANIGNNHYESVKTEGSYTITAAQAVAIQTRINPYESAALGCAFEEGAEVLYKGGRCIVMGRRFGDEAKCESYKLLCADGQEYAAAAAGAVSAAGPVGRGGGTRRRRQPRRGRKTLRLPRSRRSA
jgi:hypothetical protein